MRREVLRELRRGEQGLERGLGRDLHDVAVDDLDGFVEGRAVGGGSGQALGGDARGLADEEGTGVLAHGVVLGGEEDVELLRGTNDAGGRSSGWAFAGNPKEIIRTPGVVAAIRRCVRGWDVRDAHPVEFLGRRRGDRCTRHRCRDRRGLACPVKCRTVRADDWSQLMESSEEVLKQTLLSIFHLH